MPIRELPPPEGEEAVDAGPLSPEELEEAITLIGMDGETQNPALIRRAVRHHRDVMAREFPQQYGRRPPSTPGCGMREWRWPDQQCQTARFKYLIYEPWLPPTEAAFQERIGQLLGAASTEDFLIVGDCQRNHVARYRQHGGMAELLYAAGHLPPAQRGSILTRLRRAIERERKRIHELQPEGALP